MAEVQQNDGGKGKKGHQKKMTIRVDFTPMVDMNMLLITFFMLCTTMIKSQTLNIALPSNEKVENEENMSQASTDEAITIIIDAKKKFDSSGKLVVDSLNHKAQTAVYYYEGKPGKGAGTFIGEDNNLVASEFLNNQAGNLPQGIRKLIRDRNKGVYEEIEKKKDDVRSGKLSQEAFDSIARVIRNDKEKYKLPYIIIKATPEASYGDLVQILDEMQINQIARYQIDNFTTTDSILVVDYLQHHRK